MNTITLSSFWQFSLSLYKHDSVQTALLNYQNEFNANVNLALLCAMLNHHKMYLTAPQLSTLHQNITDFSSEFTHPIRALRQHYKMHKEVISEYALIREKLLDTELLFEQQEQEHLITQLTALIVTEDSNPDNDNLALYQALLKTNNAQAQTMKTNLTDLNQYLS